MPSQSEITTLSLDRFAPDAKAIIVAAQSLSDERHHAEVQPIHVFAAALQREPGVVEVLRRAGVDPVELGAAMERALAQFPRANEPAYLSGSSLDLLGRAEREAQRERRTEVSLEDLLNALSQELRGALGELFAAFRIGPGAFRPHLAVLRTARRKPELAEPEGAPVELVRSLVDEARKQSEPSVVGRSAELRRLLTVLERQTKSHPLLVGDPGVGKTAIVRALARRMALGDVPARLTGVRLLELETGALVAGARLRGEIDERLKKLVTRLRNETEPTILVVRGLEQLFGANAALSGVPDLLRSALERAELRLLATTVPEGLRKIQERDPYFLRLVTVLEVAEPSAPETLEMLRAVALRLEAHHRVNINEGALSAATTLAHRYLQDRRLPDSAIDLLDETAARKRVSIEGLPDDIDAELRRIESLNAQLAASRDPRDPASEALCARLEAEIAEVSARVDASRAALDARRAANRAVEARTGAPAGDAASPASKEAPSERTFGVESAVNAEDVAATLASWTGIPVQRMLEGEAEKLLGMDQRLSARVVGQDQAVRAVARAVRRGRVGLRDPRRPIGSFLFLGPSGVGKTELAKALAGQLFDDEQALTRLDMSEFMERHMAQRLIGAPPGYADSEQGGFLTEAVRRRPYSVLLFDEVEKAHQDVFNLLLQLLDEGRLTDGRGRTADFSNTVVILTSNIGSERILGSDPSTFDSETGVAALREALLERLREFFRPELLNRIEEVIVFRPLGKAELRRIVELELGKIERLLSDRALSLRVTDAAKARLVELGYEPALGARPLRRTILRYVQDPLAEALLAGRFTGQHQVMVDVSGEGFALLSSDAPEPRSPEPAGGQPAG